MEFEFDPKKSVTTSKSMGLIFKKLKPYGMMLTLLIFQFNRLMNLAIW
jgi:hypothetical protein